MNIQPLTARLAGLMPATPLLRRSISVYYVHLLGHFLSILLLTPVVIRGLGAEGYGIWVVIGSAVGYSALLDFGMNTAVAKYTAEHVALGQPQMVNRVVTLALLLYARIAIVIVAVVGLLAAFLPAALHIREPLIWPARWALIVMGSNAALQLAAGVFGNVLYGFQRVDLWKACGVVQVAATALLTLIALWLGFGIVGLAAASLCATAITMAAYAAALRSIGHTIVLDSSTADRSFRRAVFQYSGRTFMLGLTSRIMYSTDALVIGLFLGAAAVGPYDVAYKICFLMTYLFSVIATTLFPQFSRLYALGDLAAARELFLRTTWLSLVIVTPLIIATAYLGKAAIVFWVGTDNFVGWSVLLLLLAFNFSHATGGVSGLMLQAIGRNRIFVYSESINAVLNLGLSLLLVRRLGVFGVALGTVLAHTVTSTWIAPLLACRSIKLDVGRYLREAIVPPLAIGLLIAGAVRLFFGPVPETLSPVSMVGRGVAIVGAYAIVTAIYSRNDDFQLLLKWVSGGVTARRSG